jgi:hypothetical protein
MSKQYTAFGRIFSATPVMRGNDEGFELVSPAVYVSDDADFWKYKDQRFWCPKHIFERFYTPLSPY